MELEDLQALLETLQEYGVTSYTDNQVTLTLALAAPDFSQAEDGEFAVDFSAIQFPEGEEPGEPN